MAGAAAIVRDTAIAGGAAGVAGAGVGVAGGGAAIVGGGVGVTIVCGLNLGCRG